jgi:hypothetical protein
MSRAPIVAEADRIWVDVMKRSDHAVHIVIERAALVLGTLRKGWIPEDSSLDISHHIERSADDVRVIAIGENTGDKHAGVLQRLHDPALAVDGMGGGKKRAVRLFA